MAALGPLAFLGMAGTFSACTAWLDASSKDVKSYAGNLSTHFFYVIPTMVTAVANTVLMQLSKG